MGIKLVHNGISGFKEMLFARVDQAIIFKLTELGEELVKYARDNHNYTDQTGNLTNSIGYAVVRNKEIVYFGGENQPGEGSQEALKVAMKMAATLSNSYSLIIVAGMNYAAYVEAKGYNVILPAELKAKKDFPVVVSEIISKVMKKFNSK